MWFKDTGRILSSCARLTHQEIGILYCLIGYAWTRQGITENDISAFAFEQRISPELAQISWLDFQRLAENRDGKYLLIEQWEGIESYQQKVRAGKQRAETRLQKTKDLETYTVNHRSITAQAPLNGRSSTAEQNRIEEKREERAAAARALDQVSSSLALLENCVIKITGAIVDNRATETKLYEAVGLLNKDGVTVTDLEAFAAYRTTPPKLNFLVTDFREWKLTKQPAKSANGEIMPKGVTEPELQNIMARRRITREEAIERVRTHPRNVWVTNT